MWMLWYSVNIAVKIKVNSIIWWNFWTKVDYIYSVYINHDSRTQEWNDVSINNSSRSAQDNHWKLLIKKKSNFDKFCKQLINIFIKYLNIEICCFKDKQSISILQIWLKWNLWNEMKELKFNDYVNNYLETIHESETSESVHWICSIHWICIHIKAKHSNWSQLTLSLSVNWEKETHQYYHDQSCCISNSSQE